jgi:hypothetical protein
MDTDEHGQEKDFSRQRDAEVAQTGSLPYRGLAIRRRHQFRTLADCQSATQQVANLRYSSRKASPH